MKRDALTPIRVLYRQYLDGEMSFDDLMSITDRRLAEFDARYPLPADEPEQIGT